MANGHMIDIEALNRLRSIEGVTGRSLVEVLVRTFLDGLPMQIVELRSSLVSGDLDRLEHVTHSLAGAASAIGAAGIAEKCAQAEKSAQKGDLDATGRALAGLEEIVEATINALLDEVAP